MMSIGLCHLSENTFMCLLCQEIKYVSRIVELKTEDIVGHNTVKTRKKFLISKAEPTKKAGISPLTISRIEKVKACRIENKKGSIWQQS
jgi:hypothetical protein